MSRNIIFKPESKIIGRLKPDASIEEIDAETSVYAASPEFVRKHCGPIANRILDAVPASYFELCASLGMLPNIDVRVHRLNIGEFPAVPGWHCDGAYRETYFATPDVDRVHVRDTVLCSVSTDAGGVSNFDIITEPFEFEPKEHTDELGLWGQVNEHVNRKQIPFENSIDGALYHMSCKTVHRCCPAQVRGWRIFFRMSMWHNDYLGDQGKIAKQQQVYIRTEAGW